MATSLESIEYDPTKKPAPKKGVFEVGLVLAGAISAGAYIAGVMDFLIEALDAWQEAKDAQKNKPKTVPDHTTLIKVITGASGGGMNAAIAAAAFSRQFSHVRAGNVPPAPTEKEPEIVDDGGMSGDVEIPADDHTLVSTPTGNPFFDSWVNDIDITNLLGTKDLTGGKPDIRSLLDSSSLRGIADRAVTDPDGGTKPKIRAYLANPLRVFLTVSNLRGVPYHIEFIGNTAQGHGMRLHRDHVRFALARRGGGVGKIYNNEITLQPPASSVIDDWRKLVITALACGAFPVVLQPRVVTGKIADYDYRIVYRDKDGIGDPVAVPPQESEQWKDPNDFLAVDGGAMNNEPLELARVVLAGAYGHNLRDGDKANRATLLIDPFAEDPELGPDDDSDDKGNVINPLQVAMALFDAWKMQARFSPSDLALAHDEKVFSRFLIAPSRGKNAPQHLASGVLGGFGGFLSWYFRRHDYLLGRRNCQRFLGNYFVLPKENKLFDRWRKEQALFKKYAVSAPSKANGAKDHLPIIPLVDAVDTETAEEKLPGWPSGHVKVGDIEDLVAGRFEKLYFAALNNAELGWWAQTYLGIARRRIEKKLRKFVRKKLRKDLKKFNL